MIRAWWSGKKPDNRKPVAAFNIPNDNFSILIKASPLLEMEKGREADALLQKIQLKKLPASLHSEYFDRRGEAAQLTGQFKRAEKYFLKAHKSYQRDHDSSGMNRMALKLGDVYRLLEDFNRARSWYQKSHGPDALCGIALSDRGQGHFSRTLRLLKQADREFKKSNDMAGRAYVLWAEGTTHRFIGNLKEAQHCLERSVSLYKQLSDRGGEAYARCGLGGALRMRGLAIPSGGHYRWANGVFQKWGDRFGQAYSFCGWGNSLRMREKYKEAVPLMKKAIAIYQSLNQKGPEGFVRWSLAQAQEAMGLISDAKQNLNRADRLFRSVGDHRGEVYVALGRREFKKALNLARKNNMKFETIHSMRGLQKRNIWKMYRKIGVNIIEFKKYATLP